MIDFLRFVKKMLYQVIDLGYAWQGIKGIVPYISSAIRYRGISGEPVAFSKLLPQLHDRTATSSLDHHYFYANAWVTRRLLSLRPPYHVDVGSQVNLVSQLSAALPLIFIEFRPLMINMVGLTSLAGDIVSLPFEDQALPSISSIHVVEHIGLGRYGDPLNGRGTELALLELQRVLALGGNLFLAVPVGMAGTYFNAHRVLDPVYIQSCLHELTLVEFSVVDDSARFHEFSLPEAYQKSKYACGLYWFTRDSK